MEAVSAVPAVPAEPKQDQTLVRAGWVLAFLIPFVGFFVGLAAAIRGRAGHGIGIMVTSVVVGVVALSMAIGGAANEAQKSLNDAATSIQQSTKRSSTGTSSNATPGAISFNDYRAVKTGMTRSDVRGLLGAPNDISRDETDLGEFGGVMKTEMWSYSNKGGSKLDFSGFMFTFTNGKLDSKSSF